jgi:hypothetical protein
MVRAPLRLPVTMQAIAPGLDRENVEKRIEIVLGGAPTWNEPVLACFEASHSSSA